LNLRPLGPEEAQDDSHGFTPVPDASQPLETTQGGSGPDVQPFAPGVPVRTPFSTRFLPDRMTSAPRLLTVREVAVLARVSRATVYTACRAGQLEHVRVGHSIRVVAASLEGWVSRSRDP
jgi:excisionase family DNA binding protein